VAQLLHGERLEGHVQSNGRGPVALRLGHVDPLVQHRFELQVGVFDRSIQEENGGHEGVERLGDIVGMADRDQLVYFTLDAETRKLEIRICELTYTLALLDPETVRSPPDQTNSTSSSERTCPLSVRYAFAEGASSVEYLVSPRITAN
jgi:hypothetical protein